MHGFFACLTLAACGGAAVAPPVLEPPQPDPDPAPLRVGFSIEPHQLGAPDIGKRIRHRVRLARWGRASFAHDGEPIDDRPSEDGDRVDVILPVIEASGTKIQVVVEEDHARLAAWVDARDTWETVLAPTRLATTEAGEPAAAAGVVLEAGAPIELGPRGPRRLVTVRDDVFAIRGWIDTARIGRVYVVPEGDTRLHHMKRRGTLAWKRPRERRPVVVLAASVPIRLRPMATAPTLAVANASIDVALVAERPGWTEVEVVREYMRIRGFVPSSALAKEGDLDRFGTIGTGTGFGISHADRIQLPAFACLYDGIDGVVVGVQLDEHERLGRKKLAQPGWSMVYVNTPWRHTELFVRDTGSDPTQPVWESCAPT